MCILNANVDREGRRNIINVDRSDVLDGATRGFSRKLFKNECRLNVRFSGELGIDDGGPSREFMRLAPMAIQDSPIWKGDINSRTLCPDLITMSNPLLNKTL